MTRTGTTTTINLRIDPDLLARIDANAKEIDLDRSAWLRAAAEAALTPLAAIVPPDVPIPSGPAPHGAVNMKRPERRRSPKPGAGRRTRDDAKPSDCAHPLNRRIGTLCAVCGVTLK